MDYDAINSQSINSKKKKLEEVPDVEEPSPLELKMMDPRKRRLEELRRDQVHRY